MAGFPDWPRLLRDGSLSLPRLGKRRVEGDAGGAAGEIGLDCFKTSRPASVHASPVVEGTRSAPTFRGVWVASEVCFVKLIVSCRACGELILLQETSLSLSLI